MPVIMAGPRLSGEKLSQEVDDLPQDLSTHGESVTSLHGSSEYCPCPSSQAGANVDVHWQTCWCGDPGIHCWVLG